MKSTAILFLLLTFGCFPVNSQTKQTVYPRIVGYISIVHPLANFTSSGTTYNFNEAYLIGFPTGIHIIKTDKFGFSFEIVPFINSNKTESKISNVLIHPGVMFRLPNDWNIYTRLAFETSGRYGFTPSVNKIFYKSELFNAFATVPFPVRFGNNLKNSIGIGLQMGISF